MKVYRPNRVRSELRPRQCSHVTARKYLTLFELVFHAPTAVLEMVVNIKWTSRASPASRCGFRDKFLWRENSTET